MSPALAPALPEPFEAVSGALVSEGAGGARLWILTQAWGWGQDAGVHPEPVSPAAESACVTFSKGLSTGSSHPR